MHVFIQRTAATIVACVLSFTIITPLAAAAQNDPDTDSAAADGVGVARLSLLTGSVAIQRGDANDSLAAVLNAPVLGGDYVVTGDASRAEVQIDGHTQIRAGDNVQMRFTHLDAADRRLQLAAGTVDVRLFAGGASAPTAVDTPSITVKPQRNGTYRVSVEHDGTTLVTVRAGEAQIVTPQGAQELDPGTTLIAQGDAANPSIQRQTAVAYDQFDRFNTTRDDVYASARAAAAYVDPNIGGVADLAANGRWVDDSSYGHVWIPAAVGPNWAPYRDGRWVWEEGYGWTWVADEAWGWAPYHYGSWYRSPQYGWAWYPPQPASVVVWRPALVAFIGFGGGSGFSLGFGFGGGGGFANIGWVPLAPFEPYHPWWGNRYGGGAVVNNVTNITNITNVTNVNVYKNVRYNAVSSVTSQRFIQGNFTHNAAVTGETLRSAHVFTSALPVVPTASNLRFSHTEAAPGIAIRPDLVHAFAGGPAVIARTPFTAQRLALANVTRAPITPLHFKDAQSTPLQANPAAEHRAPVSAPAGRAEPPATVIRPTGAAAADHPLVGGSAGAWDRFNQHRAAGTAGAPAPNRAAGEPNAERAATVPGADHPPAQAPTYRTPSEPRAFRAPAPTPFVPKPHPARPAPDAQPGYAGHQRPPAVRPGGEVSHPRPNGDHPNRAPAPHPQGSDSHEHHAPPG